MLVCAQLCLRTFAFFGVTPSHERDWPVGFTTPAAFSSFAMRRMPLPSAAMPKIRRTSSASPWLILRCRFFASP